MDLINPSDSVERQNEKLHAIVAALMRKVEQSPDQAGFAYAQFERAAVLEEQVRQRTVDLERTLDLLHESNAQYARAQAEAEDARAYLTDAIETIEEGFALFDQRDELVLYNSRFCQDLAGVRAGLRTGLSFAAYVGLVAASDDMAWHGAETAQGWHAARLDLHRQDHVAFNIRLRGKRWMQVSEHRTDTGGTVILQTDVTGIMREERQERDRLVTKQARMLRATLDHLAQSICIFDKRRRLVGWNQRMEDLLKRPLGSSFHGGDFDSLLDRLDRLFSYERLSKVDLRAWAHRGAGRAPLSFEVRRSDDTIFDVFMQELPDGGFVISFTDITDERRTSQALRELNETLERRVEDRTTELGAALEDARRANATKTRFVAAASHDLLQPMSAAKLYASVLEDRMMEDADRDLVRKTASALESAEGIITALLDISKLDLGLATFKLAEVELDQLFASLANEFVPHALGRGLHLTFVPTSLVVESDEAHLYRILQNLVSNAVRYTTGGRILVGARRRGGDVVIEVRDQGPGISGADQQVIFQEFQQLRRSTGEPQGLGLGLAIVDRACRMLGHTLSLDSALGRGSCFSVAAPRALGAAPRTPDQPAAAPQSGVLVGLVENDDALRNSITLTIEAMGSDVFASASGEEALALFEELGVAPDCFVLDYQLGEGMLGTELVPLLRRRWGDVPMTIISANRSAELEAACTDLGVELRHKPLARADIAAILARV